MKATALIAALAAVLLSSNAEARPISKVSVKHLDRHIGDRATSCSDPVMRPQVCELAQTRKLNGMLRVDHRRKANKIRRKSHIVADLTTGHNRPRAWCGWFGRFNFLHRDPGPKYNLARNWAGIGSNAGGPAVGVIVVWRHHVGKIVGRTAGQWLIHSGNDGGRVRTRPRSVSNAIAFRWP